MSTKGFRRLFVLLGVAAGVVAAWTLNRRWDKRFVVAKNEEVGIKDPDNWLQLGRRVIVQSILDCQPQRAWEQVRTSGLLFHVAWPILVFKTGPHGMPAIWDEGESAEVGLYVLGVLPLGKHTIRMEKVDQENYELQSRESGQMAQIWNHRISIQPHGEGQTSYMDEVDIYAGKLTPLVAVFARFFYRYRQMRWQKLAKAL